MSHSTEINDQMYCEELTTTSPVDLRIRRAVNSIEAQLPCEISEQLRLNIAAEICGVLQFNDRENAKEFEGWI